MIRFVREAIAYGAVSVIALGLDFSVFYALLQLTRFGYIAASAISFLAGVIVSYVLSVRFAFREHRLGNRRDEFIGFVGIGVLGLAVNAGAMLIAVGYAGLKPLIAKFLAAGCTFLFNFLARRQLLFVKQASRKGLQACVLSAIRKK